MGAIAITEAAEITTNKSDCKSIDQLIAKATEGEIIKKKILMHKDASFRS